MKILLGEFFDKAKRSITIKSGLWYLMTNFILRGISFITIPIFTRLLDPRDYGMVSVYNALVNIFSITTGLGLLASIGVGIRDFSHKKQEFLSSVLFLSVFSFLFHGILITLFGNAMAASLGIYKSLVLLSVLAGYSNFVFNYYTTINVFERKYKVRFFLSILSTFFGVMASIAWILLMPSEKFLGRVYGDVLTKTAISVVLFLIIVIRGKRLICVETWKYSLRIGLPVILHNLAGVILVQFDRFVIQDMIGPRAVGLYSYAYNLAMAPLIILGATNLAWVPWFYDKMALNEKEDIRNKSKIYNELFLLSLIVIYITIPWLGLIMAPKTYYQSLNILPIVIASYYMQFLYTLYVNFAFYFKRTLSVAVGTVLSGVINIVLNILLVPIFGYEVAALTTLISYFLLLTFHYINVRFFLKDETLSARYVFNWAFVIISISIFHYLISINFGMFSLQEILARIILFGIVGLYVIIKIYERFVSI